MITALPRRCLPQSVQRVLLPLIVCPLLALAACASSSIIYEKKTEQGSIIVTQDSEGLRTLLFERGGARQSVVKPGDPDHLELPYTKVALVGLALCEEPRRLLVVGLGGGTLPSFLHKHYPEALIDTVEIDPEVLAVAKGYFAFREDERSRVHIDDGRRFIERIGKPTYDAIFLDAFGTASVPAHLTTLEFLQAVRGALKPSGVVVGNVWGRSANPLYDSMVRTYQEAFGEVFVLEVANDVNKMVFALPRRQNLDRAQLARMASGISSAGNYGFDLGALVERGFLEEHEPARGAVLRD